MSKATPGPWRIPTDEWPEGVTRLQTFRTHNSPTRFWETYIASEAGCIAKALGATQEEAEANAAVLAAAPDLLAVVKELASVKRAGVGKDLMQRASAAIAKAQGE